MQTRSQTQSKKVYDQIICLDAYWEQKEKDEREKLKKQYGSLCHKFPILVLHSGLSQAVGFFWAKADANNDSPYAILLKHLSSITGGAEDETAEKFQQRINQADLVNYQRLTQTILAASIWYKRFAESILHIEAGANNDSN